MKPPIFFKLIKIFFNLVQIFFKLVQIFFKLDKIFSTDLVHVHHSLDSVDFSGALHGLSLPPDAGEGDVGGEEEEETQESEERDDDGGQIQTSLSSITGGTGSITLHWGTIGLSRSTIGVRLRCTITIIPSDSGAIDTGGDHESSGGESSVCRHVNYVMTNW